ncbi:M23 family metallopeptidase [Streptomyces sannanensis]|uniref:M23 family metallopeptidase n=1 Tax=Streptomyces sannanensis TaxID=285536 RepID=A0ABP6SE26_9ACTN
MNDQHAHAGYVGFDGNSTGGYDTDPQFGTLPSGYEAGHTGQYDTTAWSTASYGDTGYTAQYEQYGQYDTTTMWAATEYGTAATASVPAQSTGEANTWNQTGQFENAAFGYDTTGQWTVPGFGVGETGAYDATAWNSAEVTDTFDMPRAGFEAEADDAPAFGSDTDTDLHTVDEADFDADGDAEVHLDLDSPDTGLPPVSEAEEVVTVSRTARRPANRARRRSPAKRSALLTVAVPSVCVMGVAGIAAASVSGLGGLGGGEKKDDGKATMAAPDASAVKVAAAANNKLDTQLTNVSISARDFSDRASRTQERIDLKERQEADRQRRIAEAARKEALRPKFALPVAQHGLSAHFGQAGVNWMSQHTGIDFPVSYGTPVMAATDGTVRTQWNSAYGNMAIVTAADGTETWYCHLSSTKIRYGQVKAGDVIAYSGNSGNSTGPHLHFEVRPGGGSAVNPLSWLLNHGLNPQ